MNKKLLAASLTAFSFALSACSTSTGDENNISIVYGDAKVFWKDLFAISNLDRSAFDLAPNESVYLVSVTSVVKASLKMPDGEEVSSWQRCAQLTTDYSGRYPKLDGDKYMDCTQRLEAARAVEGKRVSPKSFEQLVALAERAVAEEGSCKWDGYDRSFDKNFRLRTSLAFLDDERLLFVKMSCAPR